MTLDATDAEATVRTDAHPTATLVVATTGFFVVTLDAVVVNVALPSLGEQLGGGIADLPWVVDGYTLPFAALLLTAGAVSDRIGARRSFGLGLGGFLVASLLCGLAPHLGVLVAARLVQGAAAALMMPSSMALVRHAYGNPAQRARAIGLWSMGGALASSSGPLLGGALTLVSWRLIFLVNLPVGLAALWLMRHTAESPRRAVPVDWVGQASGVAAMAGITYGAIEAGAAGWTSPAVLLALGLGLAGIVAFAVSQARVRHPMVPPALLAHATVRGSMVIGFAFMVGYYGLPFVFSLYFQQERGLSALQTGALFLPMMVVGAVLTPFTARVAERIGYRPMIVGGLLVMAVGLVLLGLLPESTPLVVLSLLMVLPGLSGPTVTPPTTGVLLNSVPGHLAGTASGVFNTSRQVGGALAIAVFGGLLNGPHLIAGVRTSLLVAAAVSAVAAVAAARLRHHDAEEPDAHVRGLTSDVTQTAVTEAPIKEHTT